MLGSTSSPFAWFFARIDAYADGSIDPAEARATPTLRGGAGLTFGRETNVALMAGGGGAVPIGPSDHRDGTKTIYGLGGELQVRYAGEWQVVLVPRATVLHWVPLP